MTNESQTPTVVEKSPVEIAREKQSAANAALAKAQSDFDALLQSQGKGKTQDEQHAILDELNAARAAVKSATLGLKTAEDSEIVRKLDAMIVPLHANFLDAMMHVNGLHIALGGEGGKRVTIEMTPIADGKYTVSHRVAGVAPKPAASGESEGGARGSNVYVADGKEYASKAYLEAFAQGAIDAGKVKWTGNFLDSVGLSHRADTLATALGHEKRKATA